MSRMEAESSVIKCYPSIPTSKSATCHNVHPHNEKFQVNSTKSHSAIHRAKISQSGNYGRRSSTLQGRMKIQQEDTRNIIPVNIRHKYGSSVVDQLVSPEQVRSCMREEERTQCRQEYFIPRLTMKSYVTEDYPHKIYYELSHCLRSNLFPGTPIKQHSLVHDSYTAEVNERGRLENTHQWYGRKTDELAIWSEMLMKRKAIAEILQSQVKPSRAFPHPIQTNILKDVPPPPPPQRPPPKKPKKQKPQTKKEKQEVQDPPVSPPKQEDDFWEFYDKSI